MGPVKEVETSSGGDTMAAQPAGDEAVRCDPVAGDQAGDEAAAGPADNVNSVNTAADHALQVEEPGYGYGV
jgi:hypothetical protein